MVAIAPGVLETEAVEGTRYPGHLEMTGWYVIPANSDSDDFMPTTLFTCLNRARTSHASWHSRLDGPSIPAKQVMCGSTI
jgi:hypothetical protein